MAYIVTFIRVDGMNLKILNSQLFEIFNSLFAEVKAISTKFEGSKHADFYLTSMSSPP